MKTSKYCLLAFLLLCLLPDAQAQLSQIGSFYRFNWQYANPAAVDKTFILSNGKYKMLLNANHRQQWSNVQGAPSTSFISFENYVKTSSIRWGVSARRDRAGVFKNDGIIGNFCYFKQFTRSRSHIIHFGLNAGLISSRLNQDELRLADFGAADPASMQNGKMFLDLGAGALYRFDRWFYAGISVPQLLAANVVNQSEGGFIAADRRKNFPTYLLLGGYIELPGKGAVRSDTWSAEPSLWVRYLPGYEYFTVIDRLPVSADLDIRLNIPISFEGGIWVNTGIGTNKTARLGIGYDSELPLIRSSSNTKSGEKRMDIGFNFEFPFGKMIYPLGQTFGVSVKFAG